MFKLGEFILYVSSAEEDIARLKVAYESIPDHEKRYVEGMDDKDHRVRSICYRES